MAGLDDVYQRGDQAIGHSLGEPDSRGLPVSHCRINRDAVLFLRIKDSDSLKVQHGRKIITLWCGEAPPCVGLPLGRVTNAIISAIWPGIQLAKAPDYNAPTGNAAAETAA